MFHLPYVNDLYPAYIHALRIRQIARFGGDKIRFYVKKNKFHWGGTKTVKG